MQDPPRLPYRLEALIWDDQHHFNQQNRYGYNGKSWKKFSDPFVLCEMCDQWFPCHEVGCIPQDAGIVPFQRNYRFSCRVCGAGQEHFEVLTNTWSSIVLTAMYNMLLTDDAASFVKKEKWLKVADITAWVLAHWGSLTMGRDQHQLESNQSVPKCLHHLADAAKAGKDGPLITLSDDRSEVMLRHLDLARLQIKPLNATTIPPTLLGQTLSGKPAKEKETNKRKRNAPGKKENKKEVERGPSPPPMQDIKLPDKYRLLPVPKVDAAHAQREGVVQLSRSAKAPQIALKDDMLTATGCKGYRMVRATHGVSQGSWYFEIKVGDGGVEGHTRLGWCTEMGEVQAPVGFDQNSYSYRDVAGTKFHESIGADYGESYGPGDVIGCWLVMGDPPASVRSRQRINLKGVEYIVEEERERTPSVGSHITFFKNGKSQGAAFKDLWAEVYYPAASLFKSATVTFNFGPVFECSPDDPAASAAQPICQLASPIAPMDVDVDAPAAADANAAAPDDGSTS